MFFHIVVFVSVFALTEKLLKFREEERRITEKARSYFSNKNCKRNGSDESMTSVSSLSSFLEERCPLFRNILANARVSVDGREIFRRW